MKLRASAVVVPADQSQTLTGGHYGQVTSQTDSAQSVWWRRARWVAGLCYATVFLISSATVGIPLSRVTGVLWTLGAFAVYSIGRSWRVLGRALLDWLPFAAVMVGYDLTRGIADTLGQPVHVRWPAMVDRHLFAGAVPTVWLQQRLHTPGVVHWYDVAASLTYLSYFVVVPLLMAVLWARNRRLWRIFASNVVALSLAALVTYVVFPEAPPWYAANDEAIGSVDRLANLCWSQLGLHSASDVIERGQALANPVAAMPSLHVAYTALVAVFFLRRVPRWAAPLLLAYPVAMAFALVYTGEHYVIDILAGISYVLIIHTTINAFTARNRRRGDNADPRHLILTSCSAHER